MLNVILIVLAVSLLSKILKGKADPLRPQESTRGISNSTVFFVLSGGLGNQFFTIAAAIAFARKYNKQPIFSSSPFGGRPSYWNTWLHNMQSFKGDVQEPTQDTKSNQIVYRETTFEHMPIPENAQIVYGYFQSGKYFCDIAHEINSMFCLPSAIVSKITAKYSDLLNKIASQPYIMVHVRRGDYVHSKIFGFLTIEYYEEAIERAQQQAGADAQLIVFSDDVGWCKHQACFARHLHIDEPDEVVSLWLMSQFEHYVLSNSSFSWWSAVLGKRAKTVVVPSRWIGLKGEANCQDVFEPGWIQIDIDK